MQLNQQSIVGKVKSPKKEINESNFMKSTINSKKKFDSLNNENKPKSRGSIALQN